MVGWFWLHCYLEKWAFFVTYLITFKRQFFKLFSVLEHWMGAMVLFFAKQIHFTQSVPLARDQCKKVQKANKRGRLLLQRLLLIKMTDYLPQNRLKLLWSWSPIARGDSWSTKCWTLEKLIFDWAACFQINWEEMGISREIQQAYELIDKNQCVHKRILKIYIR